MVEQQQQKKKQTNSSLREDFAIQKQDLHSLSLKFCAAASFSYSEEQKFIGQKAVFHKGERAEFPLTPNTFALTGNNRQQNCPLPPITFLNSRHRIRNPPAFNVEQNSSFTYLFVFLAFFPPPACFHILEASAASLLLTTLANEKSSSVLEE